MSSRSIRPSVRAFRRLVVVVVGFVSLWLGVSAVAEQVMLHPRHWGVGPPPSTRGWAYQDVSFKTTGDLTLRGWWIPGTNGKTVVMIHGWTSSRREPYDKSAYLHSAGYNLLVFDLRGHGASDGTYTSMGLHEPDDARAAVQFAAAAAPGDPIALFGYSMGGAVALEDAARDPLVKAVVEDSGFSSLAAVTTADFQALTHLPALFELPLILIGQADLHLNVGQIRPIDAAAKLDKPLLAILGTADRTVPPAEGYQIFAAAPGPKQLLVVPGAGHVQGYYKEPATYRSTVLSFLATNLK